MSDVLCFKLNGASLFLEQVLVDDGYIPIFFLCRHEQQRYLALCTDMEKNTYYVVKISLQDLHALLHGQIAMRDAMLNQDKFWHIEAADKPLADVVVEHPMQDMDLSVLPEENACFKIFTQEIAEYVKSVDLELAAARKQ